MPRNWKEGRHLVLSCYLSSFVSTDASVKLPGPGGWSMKVTVESSFVPAIWASSCSASVTVPSTPLLRAHIVTSKPYKSSGNNSETRPPRPHQIIWGSLLAYTQEKRGASHGYDVNFSLPSLTLISPSFL